MKAKDFVVKAPVLGWKSAQPEVVNRERMVARAGTKIICPRCKDEIGRVSIDIYSGMRIRADSIEFATHQKRHPNERAECRKCGEPYLKHFRRFGLKTRVSTELGWI